MPNFLELIKENPLKIMNLKVGYTSQDVLTATMLEIKKNPQNMKKIAQLQNTLLKSPEKDILNYIFDINIRNCFQYES